MDFKTFFLNVGLLLLFYLDFIHSTTDPPFIRYSDKTFLAQPYLGGITVYGKTVTCQDPDDHVAGKFPAQTWTCRDMRVDGRRMAYGYNPHFTEQKICTETNGFDELGEVCRSLMDKIGVKKRLWVSLVSDATCDFIDEPRYMLNMTKISKNQPSQFRWDHMGPGHGWIYTLQCIARRD